MESPATLMVEPALHVLLFWFDVQPAQRASGVPKCVAQVPGGQLGDDPPVHLLVEFETEGLEELVGLAEVGDLGAPLEQTFGAPPKRIVAAS
jgi:hypothetical protein